MIGLFIENQKKYIKKRKIFKINRIFVAETNIFFDEENDLYMPTLSVGEEQVHPIRRLAIASACRWQGASKP